MTINTMKIRHLSVLLFLVAVGALPFSGCKKESAPAASPAAAKALYHCGMHPQIVSDRPGKCPICGMDLIPFQPEPTVPTPSTSSNVSGQSAVSVPPAVQQTIGMTVASATVRQLTLPIRAAAKVAYDPGLYNATIEHQEAVAFLRKAKAQGSEELIDQAQATVRSSQLRLRQLGLSEAQIESAAQPGHDASNLLLGGKGNRLWVYASVFDDQAALIHRGQSAELTTPAIPGRSFRAIVEGIDPILNTDTRTLRVRLGVDNTDGTLRPEMYLSATILADLGRHLAIPESAVLDTGARQLVYVETSTGTFTPREVRAGRRAEGYSEIVSGLSEGDRVATSANFLLDSESKIQGIR